LIGLVAAHTMKSVPSVSGYSLVFASPLAAYFLLFFAAPLVVYTRGGLIVALANVQLPLMALPLITALQKLDPNLEDASAALGASAFRTFFRITLPLTLPGIVAGCLLTFAATITAFISQSLIGGGQMLFMPMYIYQQASSLQNWPFAAAISLVFLVAVLACVAVFNQVGRLSRGHAAS
jgi:putative spermidine/putrescine transport system permease protein